MSVDPSRPWCAPPRLKASVGGYIVSPGCLVHISLGVPCPEFTYCITTTVHTQSRACVEYAARPYFETFWTVSLSPPSVQGNSSNPPITEREETSERSAEDVHDKIPSQGNDDLQKIIQHVSGRLDKGHRLFDTNGRKSWTRGNEMYDQFLLYALKY